MNIAILGCGYVADFYMATLSNYPELKLVGVFDRDPQRLQAFAGHYKIHAYPGFDAMLSDARVEMVLNLTNPRSHFETTSACLNAGKHVYSEKPLAMDSQSAAQLAALAKQKGLGLATAPCSLLSESAQTLWKGVQSGMAGPIKLVYAAFDDGMIHRHHFQHWKSASGAYWPAQDEFEVGCTYEHAAYVLSWLAAIFGPARKVSSYASVRVPNKGISVDSMAPDFTVACVEYDHDVVARVTCSIVAPLDKSIQIIGEDGMLYTKFVRNDGSPVYFEPATPNRVWAGLCSRLDHWRVQFEHLFRLPFSITGLKYEHKVPYARKPKFKYSAGNKPVDFLRGPAELAASVREQRPCRLSPELGVHLIELIETLQYPERFAHPRTLTSTFDPIAPLPWG